MTNRCCYLQKGFRQRTHRRKTWEVFAMRKCIHNGIGMWFCRHSCKLYVCVWCVENKNKFMLLCLAAMYFWTDWSQFCRDLAPERINFGTFFFKFQTAILTFRELLSSSKFHVKKTLRNVIDKTGDKVCSGKKSFSFLKRREIECSKNCRRPCPERFLSLVHFFSSSTFFFFSFFIFHRFLFTSVSRMKVQGIVRVVVVVGYGVVVFYLLPQLVRSVFELI